MMNRPDRKPLREVPNVALRLQYLIYPYANFSVGPLGQQSSFQIGTFNLWRDEEENWQRFLQVPRPAKHLTMYVDRIGNPIDTLWIATSQDSLTVPPERWQHLTAVLFYLAWARIPYSSVDRASAEDFYYEAFSLPVGADTDSKGHTRWSKYATTYWSDLKLHPVPEVSMRGTAIILPVQSATGPWMDFEKDLRDLFVAFDAELRKPYSRFLTALWFLQQATFRSAAHSSFAEDIQNLCTSFEALLNINRKGDSAKQVAIALVNLFRNQAPTAADAFLSKEPDPERPEVLTQLEKWVKKLYEIRNSYTHGKTVLDFFFEGRSVWQDAFEILRLAANRVILHRPEQKPLQGSMLEKRLMSVQYFDHVARVLCNRDIWTVDGKRVDTDPIALDDAIRKGQSLDPELVESITSLMHLRQALFNICMVVWVSLETCGRSECDGRNVEKLLQEFQDAYSSSSNPKIDLDVFIRRITPRINMWVPAISVANSNTALYEWLSVLKNLLNIYGRATTPILNSLATTLP